MSTTTINAKFAGTCAKCGKPIAAGARVSYDHDTRKVSHLRGTCVASPAVMPQQQANTQPSGLTDDFQSTPQRSDTRPYTTGLTDDTTKIAAKGEYKGRPCLILWMGTTKRGDEAAKLASMDGSITWWADLAAVTVTKTYPDREYRGRMEPGMTWGRLKRLRADYAQAKKDGIEPCRKCGGIHRDEDRTCPNCGCARCSGAHGDLCEED